jgi:hypothetical protein
LDLGFIGDVGSCENGAPGAGGIEFRGEIRAVRTAGRRSRPPRHGVQTASGSGTQPGRAAGDQCSGVLQFHVLLLVEFR